MYTLTFQKKSFLARPTQHSHLTPGYMQGKQRVFRGKQIINTGVFKFIRQDLGLSIIITKNMIPVI